MQAKKATSSQRPTADQDPADGAATVELISEFARTYDANPLSTVRQNALAESDASKLVLNQRVAMAIDRNFSTRLDDWGPTDQKSSGRCWLFAATNLLRAGVIKRLKLKSFEFSQSWLMFWDKLEKANYFLEAIRDTADRDVDDRTVVTILGNCVNDGGQWNMFVNIALKYGLVPKSAMPETLSSSSTGSMNLALTGRLRVAARALRALHAAGKPASDLREEKRKALDDVYTILRLHLGNPPDRFDWQWTDDKKKFHRELGMTPKAFRKKYATLPLEDYVCLVHDPRASSPFGRTFTVEYLGNVVEGGQVIYLNVEMATLKEIAMRSLKAGEPVWFGCDCSKMMHRDLAVWDARMFDYEGLYGVPLELSSKEDRLLYKRTAMNHAMLFTGVDEDHGKTRKWRVENSWGEKGDGKGFYVMNDSWFDEHLFEIAAPRSRLPAKLRAALSQAPIVLPAWDPMGSLAR
ncbi:MAG TPA: C1 family peptidase [Spirochaetia bacterium]|nr:C1 family peptidase [Spirochaetia bacterium]